MKGSDERPAELGVGASLGAIDDLRTKARVLMAIGLAMMIIGFVMTLIGFLPAVESLNEKTVFFLFGGLLLLGGVCTCYRGDQTHNTWVKERYEFWWREEAGREGHAAKVDRREPHGDASEAEEVHGIYVMVEPGPSRLWLLATIAVVVGAGALIVVVVRILS